MKNKRKINIIIITLGIVFASFNINNYNIFNDQGENEGTIEIRDETNLKNPKKSGYWTRNFIHIDGNWSDTATTYAWCSGNGSWGTPYIIENVTIDASTSPTGSGIFINNSKNDYFIIRNCSVFNAGIGYYDAGIKLDNTNNGILINNNCSNNHETYGSGIILFYFCENNTISRNTANNNSVYGILLWRYCDNNTISENTANNNDGRGIDIHQWCDNNTISGNTANNNGALHGRLVGGIMVYTHSHNNLISGNTANNNGQYGIFLGGCYNNTASGNTANNNGDYGLFLVTCNNNTISGNTVNYNFYGIDSYYDCYNNIVSGNIASNNTHTGIRIRERCSNNTVSGNTANGNTQYGIHLWNNCNNNTISNNEANDNGISGIRIDMNCDENVISDNTVNYNVDYGVYLYDDCDNNTILGNVIHYNYQYGIFVENLCDYNRIYLNDFIGNVYHARDEGNFNQWDNGTIGNYWDNYTGVDVDDNGVGDDPYNISGSVGSQDNYPIWWDPPVFSVNSPIQNETFGFSAPEFDITINEGVVNTLWYTIDEGLTNFTCLTSGKLNQTAWDDLDDGEIPLTFYANDSRDYTTIRTIIIEKDTIKPSITINSPTTNQLYGVQSPTFDVNINDPHFHKKWYSLNGGPNITFTTETQIKQAEWDKFDNGTVLITFYANDTVGNENSIQVMVRKDIIKPIIVINSPTTDDSFGKHAPTFNISIIEENLLTTWYTIEGVAGEFYFTGLVNPINQDAWNEVPEGEIIITFYALDKVGNIGNESVIVIKRITEEFPLTTIIIAISSIMGGIGVAGVIYFLLRKRKRMSEII